MPETETIPWWTATLIKIPTNYGTPFRVAVQAADRKSAGERLRKLYNSDIYTGYGSYNIEEAVSEKPAEDTDEISNCRQHPAPKSL
jgi:hypothetical protein